MTATDRELIKFKLQGNEWDRIREIQEFLQVNITNIFLFIIDIKFLILSQVFFPGYEAYVSEPLSDTWLISSRLQLVVRQA
jgi:hypothetical protein